MKKRSPIAVFVFGLITLGFYSWYWEVTTKGEMNKKGEHIPTAWIWLIPVVGYIWWSWKYSESVGNITKDKAPAILVFLLFMFTGFIGDAIVQHYFNELSPEPATTPVSTPEAAPAATDTTPTSDTPAVPPSSPSPEPPTSPTPAPATPEVPPSTDNSTTPTPPSPTISG